MMETPVTASATTKDRDYGSTSRYTPGESSMWFFIIGDLLIFGVYFVFYVFSRSQQPEVFLESQQHLNPSLGVINTIVLLTSSLLVALATEAVREKRREESFQLIQLAILFGAAFPLIKVFEWVPKIMAGHTPGENLFFMYYYVMTGLHLCHVLLGLVILVVVAREIKSAATPRISLVETGAMYWHMVDLLWLILLALLYLMR